MERCTCRRLAGQARCQLAVGSRGGGDTYAPMYGPGSPEGAKPGSKEYADWAVAQARAGNKLPQVSSTEDKYMLSPISISTVAASSCRW